MAGRTAITAFGRYLPEQRLGNAELARRLDCEAEWILQASGIEERRIAADGETVVGMGVAAGRDCLSRIDGKADLVIVSSGSAENRFPGPAAEIAQRLDLGGVPAIDLPMASAGALFGMALAMRASKGNALVIATEKMSVLVTGEPPDKNVAILFGDGAGACFIASSEQSGLELVDSVLHSDGTWCHDLRLGWTGPVQMDGRSVIMQASRKIPAAINEVLQRNGLAPDAVGVYLMHQANQNLIDRVARALSVPAGRFYSNIRKYGNTSSASMLIAASEWHEEARLKDGDQVCFAAFGAGFHWGAALARYRS